MTPSERARFNALMRLAEFRRLRRVTRVQNEWKVSLGIWAMLAAASLYTKDKPIWALLVWLIIIVAGHGWLWVRWNWIANEKDARLAMYYAEKAEGMILQDAPDSSRRPELTKTEKRFGFLWHGAALFQFLATIVLAVGLLLLRSN